MVSNFTKGVLVFAAFVFVALQILTGNLSTSIGLALGVLLGYGIVIAMLRITPDYDECEEMQTEDEINLIYEWER